MTQSEALTILKTGANVFLTGEPGAGKTHTINAYVAYLRMQGIEPAITASTGIAATHIGGMTIHSWAGIGIQYTLDKYALDKIASTEYVVKRILKNTVLIIDEISMLGPNTLDMVDAVCREVKQVQKPFGGMQVILVGDFFQLPPINKSPFQNNNQQNNFNNRVIDEYSQETFFPEIEEEAVQYAQKIFAYESRAWQKLSPIICYLTEQHRQDDDEFLSVLSAIRNNSVQDLHLQMINARQIQNGQNHDNITKLFSHNADVDRINNNELSKIKEDVHTHTMRSSGKESLVGALIKGCLSPEDLCLKKSAVVMFTKNSPREGFYNGTLGIVVDFENDTNYPIVKIHNGKNITVEPVDWSVEENGKIKAQINQIPLRLAWAITVHKSQGMSLDGAVMDLSQVFEYGQGYVALSRVRRLTGLHIIGINDKALMVHPEILKQDVTFREQSIDAQNAFNEISKQNITELHKKFVIENGGIWVNEDLEPKFKESPKKSKEKTYTEKLREKHPKAGMRWNEDEEKILIELFNSGQTQTAIAKKMGRKIGGIRSRLVKLGLIEDEVV
jgi:ATP-dependent exoDNAse (exonuclease V) alpha subunit